MVIRQKVWAFSFAPFLALILMVGLVWANHQYVTMSSGENSFLPTWQGTRLLLTKGFSPYSPETTAEIQQAAYGRSALSNESPLYFLYPYYSVVFFAPFALTADAVLARNAWMILLELALLATLGICVLLSRWRVPFWALGLLVIFSLTWYYGARTILDGDVVILAILFLTVALVAVRAEHDALAGFFLTLATIKPPAVGLFIICLLVWAAFSKRWTLVWSFFGWLALWIAAASLFSPTWTVDFVKQVIRYFRQVEVNTQGSLLAHWLPGVGKQVGWFVTAVILVLLVFEWRRALNQGDRWLYWTACLTMAVTPLAGLPVSLNDYGFLLPGFILILAVWDDRWGVLGKVFMIISLVGLSVGGWLLVFNSLGRGTLPDDNPWLYFLAPLLTVIGIYWVRWWAIRPPRLPLEELSAQLSE